ncbi:hypothetical protein Mkiyose1665_26750 [Mycobacterium kiyosense]|uniref:Uncharacterized protein n=1 Tax=Mycobacterium kiyosense TaxID=2871094 RepID=A0A9P3Q6F0_9MYCO|nr:hypothetical protein IWGMT90018_22590 [Mycobacterium kiyosense]GLB82267.1 hypothetical protein SRL2020028_15230 [Mycobacterium kiyosense]GLB95971.1 hypothetical protein SRL2020226_27470 [Mycobacterium kiyosense]GLC01540.1 hypothetical protein SRL2020400_21310 [Mycobacterium kiyosense]GLC07728.1 hypothetical protein SRL2020411_23740 [Mycobacterium kiyosense]
MRADHLKIATRTALADNISRHGVTLDESETDPVDHYRTTRKHAGEAIKNGANGPGIAGVAIGVIALVIGLAAFATGHVAPGAASVALALVAGAAGLIWLRHTHRKVRAAELRWHQAHSDRPAPPPAS